MTAIGNTLPTDTCERLQMLEAALYQLAAGDRRVRVKFNDRETEYHRGSIPFLEREVNRLRRLCSGGTRRPLYAG